jgi:molecular chaperone DnaJ
MPSFKTNLLKRVHLPIKIRIVNKKEMLHTFSVTIKPLQGETVLLRMDTKNYLLFNYLRISFRKELLKKSKDGMAFSIDITALAAKEKLSKLVKRKKILNYPTAFLYDEAWLGTLLYPQAAESARFQVQVFRDDFVVSSYELLKSSPVDTLDVIKKRYIGLVKKFHPDRIYAVDRSRVAEFTEKFQMVQRAYEAVKRDKSNTFPLAS